MRSVDASRGFEWWKSGFETVFKAPAVFLVMGLAWGIPVVNFIAGLLNPALQAGVQNAVRKLDAGQMPEVGDLFSGLQTRAGPLIVLCVLPIVFMIVLVILAFLLGGGAVMAAIASSNNGQMNPAALAGMMGSLGLVVLIAIPLGLALFAMMFFAVSRTMFDNVATLDALKESLAASMKNIGAMLVFIACGIAVVIGGALFMIIPILGPILFATVLYPVVAVASYRAYLDVFQPVVATANPMTAPPPPPGAPGW